jgi:hypothetical protein
MTESKSAGMTLGNPAFEPLDVLQIVRLPEIGGWVCQA